jgi:hypothetical protein
MVWCSVPPYVFMVWCLIKHRDNFSTYGQVENGAIKYNYVGGGETFLCNLAPVLRK